MEEHGSQFITVRISYLEIYNETIHDLLSLAPPGTADNTPLSVVESPQGVSVKGLTLHPAPHEEVALNLLFEVSGASERPAFFSAVPERKDPLHKLVWVCFHQLFLLGRCLWLSCRRNLGHAYMAVINILTLVFFLTQL